MIYSSDRVALFVDGSNLAAASKALNMPLDFRSVQHFFRCKGKLTRAAYYTAIKDSSQGDHDPLRKIMDWLDYNNWHCVTKQAKVYKQEDGTSRMKGNMDVEIAVDMVQLIPHFDVAVLFSGDGDFCYAVKKLQDQGRRVIGVSTIKSVPPLCADTFRRQVDVFMELDEFREEFQRKPEDTNGA